jgi:hypothetical protein
MRDATVADAACSTVIALLRQELPFGGWDIQIQSIEDLQFST